MLLEEKIHDLFLSCSGSNGTADFRSISKVLWTCLNNAVSIVDLAGVFTVSVPGNGIEMLNHDLFAEFIKAFARLRYPTNPDFCNLVLDEIRSAKGLRANTETPFFAAIMDKNVLRILLKYDLALRRAYSNFCGQSVRVGGILNWDEVKNLSIGMEVGLLRMADPIDITLTSSLVLFVSYRSMGSSPLQEAARSSLSTCQRR